MCQAVPGARAMYFQLPQGNEGRGLARELLTNPPIRPSRSSVGTCVMNLQGAVMRHLATISVASFISTALLVSACGESSKRSSGDEGAGTGTGGMGQGGTNAAGGTTAGASGTGNGGTGGAGASGGTGGSSSGAGSSTGGQSGSGAAGTGGGIVDAGTDGSTLTDCAGLTCPADEQVVNVVSPALGTTQCACVPISSGGRCTDCTCGASICAQYAAHCTGFALEGGLVCIQNG